MRLARVEADQFRNLKAISIEPDPGLTVISGRNGQGKTSILEAIHVLATGRSFRTRRQQELIGWEQSAARVSGRVETERGASSLSVVVDSEGRRQAADGIEKELEEYLGRLQVVDLTLERAGVLRGAPEDRRRFLDRGIVGIRPGYIRELGDYRRALQQRNAWLRRAPSGLDDLRRAELEAWNERLVIAAEKLHKARREYAARLAGFLGETATALFPPGRTFQIEYRPSPASTREIDPDDFPRILNDSLSQNEVRDIENGHTTIGPHRDEMRVELASVDLRKFGSAGQVRAGMIALKLAKIAVLQEASGEPPVFLMDDFDTDLDEVRAGALADYFQGDRFQVIAATSKEAMVDRLGSRFSRVHVDDGVAQAG